MPAVILTLMLTGCSAPKQAALMHTPVIYYDSAVDLAHLGSSFQTTTTSVFYATNRKPEAADKNLLYGNELSGKLHFGQIDVRMGESDTSW